MATRSAVFLEVIEWFDSTGKEIVHRIPETGSGEIKYGAQLTVRDSQAAVFFYCGKAYDAFGPGRTTLKTANFPILTKILSIPWGMTSPLRAEVVFVNMKVFPDLKWGTRDPVAFKDSKLGLVRLRAFGVFNIRVVQPVLFVNSLAGTIAAFTTEDIESYINQVIVSRFNDHMGEHLDSLLDIPGRYEELSKGLAKRVEEDLAQFGIALSNLYIESITPPEEVQKAIDDRSRLGLFEDLGKLGQMKAAMAIEKAAESSGSAGTGTGLAFGMALPAMFSGAAQSAGACVPGGGTGVVTCAGCEHPMASEARFCPSCGHQVVIHDRCTGCGTSIPPGGRFCPGCGHSVDDRPRPRKCPHCAAENLPDATFCNQCGERIQGA
jgi:membrane protease subunit (stomatin/prohibitin family)